jgi:glucan phosphoethanolaminetransferase (alkaline phosphatase superfamily)
MKSDEILIKTFDQVKNDNFDQVKFDQVIVCHLIGALPESRTVTV